MINQKFKIFLDFDGTITKDDVGEAIFRKFLNEDVVNEIVDNLVNDRISARECWENLCESASNISKYEFDEFIHAQIIDPSFHRFVKYCKDKNFDLSVLSDGFDYYISKILQRENLQHLKYFSNKLIFSDDGKLIPSFPFYNSDCRSSANCKRNHIIENSGEGDYTVFVGDGISDNDAIQYVDFIFAKSDLLKYCEVQRITYFPFKNFDDVISRLDDLSNKKRLKKKTSGRTEKA